MSIFSEDFDVGDVLHFNNISQKTKSHLSEVYKLLAFLVGSCAAGVVMNIKYDWGNGGTSFLGFLLIIYVSCSSGNSLGRLSALLGFGVLEGMSLGKLIELAIEIDPCILVTALLATLGVFVSFSLSALWSDRRHSLYISGFLMTAVHILLLMSLLALFGYGTELMFNVNLYFGLFIMAGFVFVDTQLMINRCENNSEYDSYKDSLMMFIDIIGLFVRILIILMKNSKKDDDDDD